MDTREIPRFNHVALSLPADRLDEAGRARLLDFYGDVFGWSEMPTMTVDRELFVFRCYSNEQFVYLHASDAPMRGGAMDHWGMSVSTPAELDSMYERACKRRDSDPDVELVERKTDDFKVVKLTSFYVRYQLPLWIELQCFEWAQGAGPERTA